MSLGCFRGQGAFEASLTACGAAKVGWRKTSCSLTDPVHTCKITEAACVLLDKLKEPKGPPSHLQPSQYPKPFPSRAKPRLQNTKNQIPKFETNPKSLMPQKQYCGEGVGEAEGCEFLRLEEQHPTSTNSGWVLRKSVLEASDEVWLPLVRGFG